MKKKKDYKKKIMIDKKFLWKYIFLCIINSNNAKNNGNIFVIKGDEI